MSDLSPPKRVEFLGLDFDQVDQDQAIEMIERLSRGETFRYVVTPNVDHLVRLHSEVLGSALWAGYRAASLSLCDSRVLQRLARLSGIDLATVPGSDLTAQLLDEHLHKFPRVAVIGGDLDLIRSLQRRYEACEWYHHMPPMGVRSDLTAQRAIIEFVHRRNADLYLFAIGSPQSELLCLELVGGEARGVGLCIGASLEFVSGAKKRAPFWLRRLGLEWFFRLSSEPLRLWRRYLVEGPAIFRIWWNWRPIDDRHRAGCDSR